MAVRRRIFNTLYCREATISDETGIASYNSASPDIPVGQIIAARPLTPECNTFSFVVVNTGTKGCISIGLVHRHYPAHRQPGWDHMSIAYHADDGGIFHEYGHPIKNVDRVGIGEIMGCTLNFSNQTVSFFRNNIEVYRSNKIQIPYGGFYPAIGFHSFGESVSIIDRNPWLPSDDEQENENQIVYHSLHCRELNINHTNGILSYYSTSPRVPVGQFIGAKPLTPNCNAFSFVIVNEGTKGCIAIGLCHRHYPAHRQPGWEAMSIAYHADDGKIYGAKPSSRIEVAKVKVGEVMGCQYSFPDNTVIFSKNKQQVFKTKVALPVNGFYPVIGMHSFGETVQLLETAAWQGEDSVQNVVYHTSFCREALIDHGVGYIRYNSAEPNKPVAQVIAKNPLTCTCNKFSIVIMNPGLIRAIAIGLCDKNYPPNHQPGWTHCSVGYHADDGGIFLENGHPNINVQPAHAGDTMTCELIFSTNTVKFYLRNQLVYESQPLVIPADGFYPIVGLHSYGEMVRLVEKEPWSSTAHTSDGGGDGTVTSGGGDGTVTSGGGEGTVTSGGGEGTVTSGGGEDTVTSGGGEGTVTSGGGEGTATSGGGDGTVTSGGGGAPTAGLQSGGGDESRSIPLCGICMENTVNRFLNPCGHTFCHDCILQWEERRRECPTCRDNFKESRSLFF